jgi:hypothetical protein
MLRSAGQAQARNGQGLEKVKPGAGAKFVAGALPAFPTKGKPQFHNDFTEYSP